MALIRWNPWRLSSLLDEDWDFPTLPGISRLGQGLNLYETEDAVVAEAALPGIPEDKIDVTVDDGVVRISAIQEDKQEDNTSQRYFMRSISNSYNYAFRIPEGLVQNREPQCELEDGVLKMKFQKVEKTPPKKIAVSKKGSAKKIEAK